MKHAIEVAGDNGCSILQLTSNKKRKETDKFYKNLGFSPTHVGYKFYF
jgi:GNAT superfamily N-acetyltransferase